MCCEKQGMCCFDIASAASQDVRCVLQNLASWLLKQGYPHVNGLQPTALGNTLGFEVQTGEFVQVLHTSGCHWLTISTIGCKAGHVNVYDSLLSVDVSLRTKEEIATILFSKATHIFLHFQAVQIQRGTSDRGLFALAFATSLCHGEDPVQINYVQHKMRSHLLRCLEDRTIAPFPRGSRKRRRIGPRAEVTVELHCFCRLPESGKMIQCDLCQQWFHFLCINLPETVNNSPWFCDYCDTCT